MWPHLEEGLPSLVLISSMDSGHHQHTSLQSQGDLRLGARGRDLGKSKGHRAKEGGMVLTQEQKLKRDQSEPLGGAGGAAEVRSHTGSSQREPALGRDPGAGRRREGHWDWKLLGPPGGHSLSPGSTSD